MFASRPRYLFVVIWAIACLATSLGELVAGEAVSVDADRVAIQGYDTVAYFTAGKPVKGSPEFEAVWQGARWQFANAEHQDMFSADPETYAPRFGGYCVMGMTMGLSAKPNPRLGRLSTASSTLLATSKTLTISTRIWPGTYKRLKLPGRKGATRPGLLAAAKHTRSARARSLRRVSNQTKLDYAALFPRYDTSRPQLKSRRARRRPWQICPL